MYLKSGLSIEDAGRICMRECRAMCCRGPQFLRLRPLEVPAFVRHAETLGVTLNVVRTSDGSGDVRFPDHAGEHCPMLDDATSECRIYADRPTRCREFPDKLRPGCAISGGDGEVASEA
jgi:Fe-S-cluster containining protein